MSLVITCTIKVEQQTYDVPVGGEIFTEQHNTSITGSFDVLHGEIVKNMIEAAADGATESALRRLRLLKANTPVTTAAKNGLKPSKASQNASADPKRKANT